MNTERWHQVDRIFQLAVEHDDDARARFLDTACGGDVELRRAVETLLRIDAEGVAALDAAIAGQDAAITGQDAVAVPEGTRVGPYRIGRLVGEGAGGAVFLAERDDARFDRQVAVKFLKQALFSREALARFHQECRLLARLEHPNVARLYDAGTTDAGVPYMVLEYVEGRPIDRFAAERALTLEATLRLFREVCAAVVYAHQRLIVHRDLKPSNVLVTADGRPKLLDFGIAKLLEPADAGGPHALTRTAFQPMTPQYASPEQLRGETVTTASDVFSLGLLLYELLTGTRPYDVDGDAGARESLAAGVLVVPRPSARRRSLYGDLDTITLTALAPRPERRYASAERLSDDVRRHLSGLPLEARAPTFVYRAGRFVRRHAVGVTAAGLILALAVGSAISIGLLARELAGERDRARVEAATASAVRDFMVGLFEASRPELHRGREPTARELLVRGAERIRSDLGQRPEVRAALLEAMGEALASQSLYDDAAELLESALDLRRGALGRDHPEAAATALKLAAAEMERSRLDRAETLAREALAVLGPLAGGDLRAADAMAVLGSVLTSKGSLEEAEALLREALAARRRGLGEDHPDVGVSHQSLSALAYERRDWVAMREHCERALDVLVPVWGDDHPAAMMVRQDLATALQSLGDDEGALANAMAILETQKRLYGDAHAEIAATLSNLGVIYYEKEDYAEAESHFRASVEMGRSLVEDDTIDAGRILVNLGRAVERQGRLAESVGLLEEGVAVLQDRLEPGSPSLGLPQTYLGEALTKTGRAREAEPLLRSTLALVESSLGADHYRSAMTRVVLARCLTALGRYEESERLLLAGRERLEEHFGPDHRIVRQASGLLEELYLAWDKPELAARYAASE